MTAAVNWSLVVKEQPIVCLGIIVADVVGRPLRTLPDPGRLVLVDEMSLHTGGCAVNTATALARLDAPVAVIGKVGSGPLGDFCGSRPRNPLATILRQAQDDCSLATVPIS